MTVIDLKKHDYITDFMDPPPTPDFKKAALVIIDMQYATGSPEGALGRKLKAEGNEIFQLRFGRITNVVVPNITRLLTAFRRKNGKIVYTRNTAQKQDASDCPRHVRKLFRETGNYAGSRENEIIDELKPLPNEYVVDKTTVGAFASTNMHVLLTAIGVEQLFFTGVSTNICVDTTARGAADRGFVCSLVDDACGAPRPEYHDAAITSFQRLFGRVVSTDEVLKELELS